MGRVIAIGFKRFPIEARVGGHRVRWPVTAMGFKCSPIDVRVGSFPHEVPEAPPLERGPEGTELNGSSFSEAPVSYR